MYDDNNDIKKRQVEVLKEGLELQNDVNEYCRNRGYGIQRPQRAIRRCHSLSQTTTKGERAHY